MKKLILIAALLASSSSWGACISGNCINGIGTFISASGNKYVGEFQDGKSHGQGTHTYANGDKYVGEWKDAKRHGQGTYTYANGNKYVGEFQDDKYHGQGTFTFASGDKYVGEWKDGKRHGQATYTYPNGDKYIGEYQDNKQHGQGTYIFASGRIKTGLWENDSYFGTKAQWDAEDMTQQDITRQDVKGKIGYCNAMYSSNQPLRNTCLNQIRFIEPSIRAEIPKQDASRNQERKKKILADLKQRCDGYGFTGESNISACIQREAQVDVALAKQQHEIDLLNQQAAAEAEDDTGDDFMDDLLSIFNTLENNKKDKRLKKAEAEVKARRRAERNRQSVCVLNRNC